MNPRHWEIMKPLIRLPGLEDDQLRKSEGITIARHVAVKLVDAEEIRRIDLSCALRFEQQERMCESLYTYGH